MSVNARKRISVFDISTLRVNDDEDETLLFCQFLDDFYKTKNDKERFKLVKEEPVYDNGSKEFMCMLACAVHKLTNDYNLENPKWIFNKKYSLNEECYAFHTKNTEYQEFLKLTTPPEYRLRNLFYGEDILKRC